MTQKTMVNDLTQGNIYRQLLAFAAPVVAANLLQLVYSMVDTVVVGQFCGSAGLSAVSISSQVVTIMTVFCIGFATGGQIHIAQLVGARRADGLRAAIGTLFTLTLLLAVLMTAAGIVLCAPVLRWLNTPEEAWTQAREYLLISSGGMVFVYGYNVVSAILRGMGDANRPLVFIGIAAVLNLVLDLVFVGPLGMGAAGAAWATIIGQAVSFLISIIYLWLRRTQFGFDFRLESFRMDRQLLGIYLRYGLPLAIKLVAINGSMTVVAGMVNAYGVVASAAFGVGTKVQTITMNTMLSVAAALTTVAGQNAAARCFSRARRATWTGIAFAWVMYAVITVIFILWPVPVFRIFTQDAQVLAYAPLFLHTLIVSFPAMGTLEPVNGLVQGVGAMRYYLILALVDAFVFRIGLTWLFGSVLGMGLLGIFLGFALAPYSTMIPNVIFLCSHRWERRFPPEAA